MDAGALREASRRLREARRLRQMAPLLSSDPAFGIGDAYRVARFNHDALVASGETPIGRKIGFTNRGIWDEYQVFQPIWAHVYASTVRLLEGSEATLPAAAFCQPRIEPEIVVRLARAPVVAEPRAIAECLEWVAHGYEIVDCHFRDWKFAAADTIADFGLHAGLVIGPRVEPARIPDFVESLSAFEIQLSRDGEGVDRGRGRNVLDGPLHAIAHLMRVLAEQDVFPPLAAGEIVTTGTLTAAWPIAAGQRWETRLQGIPLPGLRLALE